MSSLSKIPVPISPLALLQMGHLEPSPIPNGFAPPAAAPTHPPCGKSGMALSSSLGSQHRASEGHARLLGSSVISQLYCALPQFPFL